MRSVSSAKRSLRAVTLTETIASCAALVAASALVIPTLGEARRQGKETVCIKNLGTIAQAGMIHAAGDPNELAVPIHPLAAIAGTTLRGEREWGGKSGIGDSATSQPFDSVWGTAGGRGPATRALNHVIYGSGFPNYADHPGPEQVNWISDTQLNLDAFHCPGDCGYTGYHLSSFRDGKLTSYDHYGNSYTAVANWIGVAGATCRLSSNSSFYRPVSRIPAPAGTILFLENAGRFAWRINYGADGCGSLVGCSSYDGQAVAGWHGRDFMFNVAFADAHVAATRIQGHQVPQPNIGRYPPSNGLPTSAAFWHCVTIRGPHWQVDTLPAPPIQTAFPCSVGGSCADPIQ